MYRSLMIMFAAVVAAAGCAQPQGPMEMPKKPDPAPQMAQLAPFVGTWSGSAEMVSPSPEEMRKMMPEGSPEMPSSYAGGGTTDWALNGMFLKSEGWYEMGDNQRAAYHEIYTWDEKAGKYHVWYFSDWGESGEGWMTVDEDGKTYHMKAKGRTADGATKRSEGRITFVDHDTMEWTWSEKGPEGKMKFKGTSKRQR